MLQAKMLYCINFFHMVWELGALSYGFSDAFSNVIPARFNFLVQLIHWHESSTWLTPSLLPFWKSFLDDITQGLQFV